MLSQTVEYALRAVVCLARPPRQYLTTAQLAAATQVPTSYLSKVMQSLVRARIVLATRGIHGGYSLAVVPERLSLLEVVSAIDPLKRIQYCPLGLEEHGANLCPLHRRLDNLAAQAQEAFATTTIAQLLEEESQEASAEADTRSSGHGACGDSCCGHAQPAPATIE